MKWMCGVVLIFSLLTVFLSYEEYQKHRQSSKAFFTIAFMELVVAGIVTILIFQ